MSDCEKQPVSPMDDCAEAVLTPPRALRQVIQDELGSIETDFGDRMQRLSDKVEFGIGHIGDLLYDLQPNTREQEVAGLLRDLGYSEALIPEAVRRCHERCSGDDTVGTYCGSVVAGQKGYEVEPTDEPTDEPTN